MTTGSVSQAGSDSGRRLLLIAPPDSYRTAAYLTAAREQGIAVLVASEGRHSLVSEIAAGLHIDLQDPQAHERLLAAHQRTPLCGVVATDDAVVELGARVASRLGLPHNPPDAARCSRRKDLSRQALLAAGVAVPRFRLLEITVPDGGELDRLPYPCVFKPLVLSGSRGVIRVDDARQAARAIERIRRILVQAGVREAYESAHLLAESFVSGPEVALEGLLRNGELTVLALFDKPDPMEGPYFEETYYITPSRHTDTVQARVIETVQAACAGLGLREGPVHAELRLARDRPVVMEVASRTIGGECARLLRFGTGHSLEALVIAHAVGRPLHVRREQGAAGVLMLPIPEAGILRRIEGLAAARAVAGIEDIVTTTRDGYELVPLPEGSSYLGFMFAQAGSADAAEAALREAHARLKVVVAPLLQLADRRSIAR